MGCRGSVYYSLDEAYKWPFSLLASPICSDVLDCQTLMVFSEVGHNQFIATCITYTSHGIPLVIIDPFLLALQKGIGKTLYFVNNLLSG